MCVGSWSLLWCVLALGYATRVPCIDARRALAISAKYFFSLGNFCRRRVKTSSLHVLYVLSYVSYLCCNVVMLIVLTTICEGG